MMRLLLTLIVICAFNPASTFAQAIYKGRIYNAPVCSNPNCAMCNQIRAQLQAPVVTAPVLAPVLVPVQTPIPTVSTSVEYETIQVPVVSRVRRCNGVSCWYENVTTYRTERRPVARVLKAVKNTLLRVTDLVPTPREAVAAMVALANPQPNEVLYDLGCGDGRILIEATYKYNCRSVGVELNVDTFKEAANNVDSYGISDKVRLYQGDVLTYTYDQANIVTMYLYPELIEQILPKLRKGTRVISYLHPFTGSQKVELRGYTFYTRTL